MSAQIFQFSNAPRRLEKIKTSTRVGEDIGEDIGDDLPAEIDFRSPEWKARKAEKAANRPVTAINSDLRKERRKNWRQAGHVTEYWQARLDWNSALSCAQSWGVADSANFPATGDIESRWKLVDTWREAVVKQLLTPAPDLGAINWKRAKLASRDFASLPTKPERIERAIADDEAWLAAHPTRRTGNVEACAKTRAFKEAMRQRIREIAASLNLSDMQIKPALKLKHFAIAGFVEEHSINIEWLLEGRGNVFK